MVVGRRRRWFLMLRLGGLGLGRRVVVVLVRRVGLLRRRRRLLRRQRRLVVGRRRLLRRLGRRVVGGRLGLGGWRVMRRRVVWRRRLVVGVGRCRRRLRVVVVGRLVVVRVGWWLGWFRRGLVLVVGGLGWGWVSCWLVRGCRCRRGCGRCLRGVVWIRGWWRCWGVRWSIIRLWWGGWSRWLIRCMRSR